MCQLILGHADTQIKVKYTSLNTFKLVIAMYRLRLLSYFVILQNGRKQSEAAIILDSKSLESEAKPSTCCS